MFYEGFRQVKKLDICTSLLIRFVIIINSFCSLDIVYDVIRYLEALISTRTDVHTFF